MRFVIKSPIAIDSKCTKTWSSAEVGSNGAPAPLLGSNKNIKYVVNLYTFCMYFLY